MQTAEYRPGHNLIIPPLEQWTGGSMHKACQAYHQKCFDNNSNDINLIFLQIRLMSIGTGLPSLAILFV